MSLSGAQYVEAGSSSALILSSDDWSLAAWFKTASTSSASFETGARIITVRCAGNGVPGKVRVAVGAGGILRPASPSEPTNGGCAALAAFQPRTTSDTLRGWPNTGLRTSWACADLVRFWTHAAFQVQRQ